MLKGIKIKEPSSFFTELVNLDLFYDEDPNITAEKQKNLRYSIVYGKNGSGKTSISKAFYSIQSNDNNYELLNLYDNENNDISINKENIFVFNEQFIEHNVKISSDDSINAIVLFGKSVELDEKINISKKIIEEETDKIAKRNIDKFFEKKNSSCLEDCLSSITNQLKNTWAIREQEIKNLSKKGSVKDDFSRSFLKMEKPKKSSKELKSEYDSLLFKINKTRDKNEKLCEIDEKMKIKSLEFYNEILSSSFDKKTTTKLSLKILNLLDSNSSKYLEDSLDILKNQMICPLCYQEIPEEHKNNVLDVLNELFDKTIKEEKDKILAERLELIQTPDFAIYRGKINDSSIDEYLKIVNETNETIKIINSSLEEKAISIYHPHDSLTLDINYILKKYQDTIDNLNNNIKQYNNDVINFSSNLNRAIEVNKMLSYFEVETLINLYKTLSDEYEKILKDDNESKGKISDAENDIRNLLTQKNNFSIALDEINDSLSYIFNSRKRMSLKMTEDGLKYYIQTNGRKTKFSRLSTGEKNIIGLVYYYEYLKKNCLQGHYFSNASIYIIDDPISSFDYDNKIGILSFLKKMINEISKGNGDNQILILTHELEVTNFVNKIFDDLNLSKKSCSRELVNKNTKRINPTKYTTYGKLLLEVYYYIIDDSRRNTISIGNIIRRLVEAYSYFNYNETMDKFLSKEETFNKIKDDELKHYFKNRMNRILMNEVSHSEDVIRQAPDTLNFDLFSEEDILKTAKDIICLLYTIDSIHVDSYLSNESNYKRNVETWINEIKDLYASN